MPLDNSIDTELKNFVCSVVSLLARKDYTQIECLGWIPAGSAVDLERYIANYGATIVEFPTGDDSRIEVRSIAGTECCYHVIADLLTEEEGRSDLSLVLRLVQMENHQFKVMNFDVDVL